MNWRGQSWTLWISFLFFIQALGALAVDDLVRQFSNPPDEAKPWVFIWWMGETTPEDVTAHLEQLKAKGIGGFLLFDMNRLLSQGKRASLLSEPWRALYHHTVREAARLNLKMGVNICAGWPAGGPWITPELSPWMIVSSELTVKGPRQFANRLPEPPGRGRLYADIAVHAFPVKVREVVPPKMTASANPKWLARLTDGNYNTAWSTAKNQPGWVQLDFGSPRLVEWVLIDAQGNLRLEVSDDGKTFRPVLERNVPRYNKIVGPIPATRARYFRLHTAPNGVVRDLLLGSRAEVERFALSGAKRAVNNKYGPTQAPLADQVACAREELEALPGKAVLDPAGRIDLTDRIDTDGRLTWDVPPGRWLVVRVARTTADIGCGGGMLVDYLNPAAMDRHFDQCLKPLIEDARELAGTTMQYFHEDNVEIGEVYSWTPRLPEEFRARRGYDPTSYLAALAGRIVGSAEVTDRFLADVRRTIADCVAEHHYGRWAELSHARGMLVRGEAGGQHLMRLLTNDGLQNQGRMDIPFAEFWENPYWKENQWEPRDHHTYVPTPNWDEAAQNVNAKQAASAGHLYGKPVIGAEAFTSLGARARWGVGPADLRPYANIAFCEGINFCTIHGSVPSGPADGRPGKVFAAGTHFSPGITWWEESAPFVSFLTRCQHLLRQGSFVADVLYYEGDEAPAFVPPKRINPGLGFGYDYDVCNTEVLLKCLSVKDGRIVTPEGQSYRLLILPERPVLPLAVVRKLRELAAGGATIIGPPPTRTPGLEGWPGCDAELKKITADLWAGLDGKGMRERTYGRGRVIRGRTPREVLAGDGVPVDFACRAEDPKALVDFIHRRVGDREIYFVTNRRNRPLKADCFFRATSRPELWDPVSGGMRALPAFTAGDGGTTIPLRLEPYGSYFVVFEKTNAKAELVSARAANFPEPVAQGTLTGPWQVTFDPAWGGPDRPVVFPELADWSKHSEAGIRFYSGRAVYRKTFDLPTSATRNPKSAIFLDLGEVRNVARVRLNGQDLGIVWCAPWRVELGCAMRDKANVVEIEVVNLWPNRLIGDAALPPEKRLTRSNTALYNPNTPLLPSGLLGPVRWVACREAR